MKKGKIAIILGVIAIVLLIGVVSYAILTTVDDERINEDSLAFKAEYEYHNNKPDEDNPDRTFKEIIIPEYNPFRYTDFDEIIDLLENNGTGIIYLGFPTCPWCRNLVPVLTEIAIDFGISEILYRNIFEDRNVLELQTRINSRGREVTEIIETRAGHPGYYRLMELLGDLSSPYVGLDDDSIRRIYAPTIIFIKDGEVVNYFGNLPYFLGREAEEDQGGWQVLNEDEIQELTEFFKDYFTRLFGN